MPAAGLYGKELVSTNEKNSLILKVYVYNKSKKFMKILKLFYLKKEGYIMSKGKSKKDLQIHQQSAINTVNDYLTELINSNDKVMQAKADKLSYWLKDWTNFLRYEPNFCSRNLKTYKRGQIIKVHLGFNIGSEEGGLHYAVVIDTNNKRSSPVLTVVPLTSVKPYTNIEKLHCGNVFLGNELYISLNAKLSATIRHLKEEINMVTSLLRSDTIPTLSEVKKKLQQLEIESALAKKMQQEIHKMKSGSIALVNQITTISKIRIYDPKTEHDILSGIRLSNEKLDLLDAEIIKMYTKK